MKTTDMKKIQSNLQVTDVGVNKIMSQEKT